MDATYTRSFIDSGRKGSERRRGWRKRSSPRDPAKSRAYPTPMASSPNGSVESSQLLGSDSGSLSKPLYTHESSAAEALAEPEEQSAKKQRWLLVYSILAVVAYLSVGVVTFTTMSGMRPLDALYFSVVTLTTVGYGDLSAHTPATKLFACFYILIGVAMVGAFLSTLVEIILDQQESMMLKMLKKRQAKSSAEANKANDNHVSVEISDQGDGRGSESETSTTADTEDDNNGGQHAMKVVSGLLFFLILVVVGTAVFKISGDMSVVDALYLTVVSSSTVGYGDYSPQTRATRLFAIFFLPLSTLVLAKAISDYTELRVETKRKERQERLLLATMTKEDYERMDSDGDGKISPLEFMCRTLVVQEKVTQADIDKVMARFRFLDANCDGSLEEGEILRQDKNGDGLFTEADC